MITQSYFSALRRCPIRTLSQANFIIHSCISTNAAFNLLDLSSNSIFTKKEIRQAYLTAAKKCHPDTTASHRDINISSKKTKIDPSKRFREITEAYEHLQQIDNIGDSNDDDLGITRDEDKEYRIACQEILGVSAEVVEECKTDPAFRQWLLGKTDAAYHWKMFFMLHGGMAPMLRREKAVGFLEEGGVTRRQRRTRR
mmetsp:Transcript_21658/g.26823  ORF Transcript_21658/g.26823 Transcript_21658/m.26823 type:complete len:198 (+) Transcript_21658:83-676(+)